MEPALFILEQNIPQIATEYLTDYAMRNAPPVIPSTTLQKLEAEARVAVA